MDDGYLLCRPGPALGLLLDALIPRLAEHGIYIKGIDEGASDASKTVLIVPDGVEFTLDAYPHIPRGRMIEVVGVPVHDGSDAGKADCHAAIRGAIAKAACKVRAIRHLDDAFGGTHLLQLTGALPCLRFILEASPEIDPE